MMRLLLLLCFFSVSSVWSQQSTDQQDQHCASAWREKVSCFRKGALNVLTRQLGMRRDIDIKQAIRSTIQCMSDHGCDMPMVPKAPYVERKLIHELTEMGDQIESRLLASDATNKPAPALAQCVVDQLNDKVEGMMDSCLDRKGVLPFKFKPGLLKKLAKKFGRGERAEADDEEHYYDDTIQIVDERQSGLTAQDFADEELNMKNVKFGMMKLLTHPKALLRELRQVCPLRNVPAIVTCVHQQTGVDAMEVHKKRDQLRQSFCTLRTECDSEVADKLGHSTNKVCNYQAFVHRLKVFKAKCDCTREHVQPAIEQCAQDNVPIEFDIPGLARESCEAMVDRLEKVFNVAQDNKDAACENKKFEWRHLLSVFEQLKTQAYDN